MARKKPIIEVKGRIKLQINKNTIVIVKSQEALQMWMKRHPEAKILSDNTNSEE